MLVTNPFFLVQLFKTHNLLNAVRHPSTLEILHGTLVSFNDPSPTDDNNPLVDFKRVVAKTVYKNNNFLDRV